MYIHVRRIWMIVHCLYIGPGQGWSLASKTCGCESLKIQFEFWMPQGYMALPVTGDWAICQNPEAGANAVCSQRCLSSRRNETLGDVRNTLVNTSPSFEDFWQEEESYRKLSARLSLSIEWKSMLLEHLEHHQCLCPTWTTAPSAARSGRETEMTRVTFKTQDFRTFLSRGRLLRNDWEILC